jgi:hypothetical protein
MKMKCLRAGLLASLAFASLAGPAAAWSPRPAAYGVGVKKNVPVTMSDGTVLRAYVFFPTDPKTGARRPGRSP